MRRLSIAAIAGSIAFSSPSYCETLNNDSIIAMAKAGLSEGLVVDKINSEPCNYDISTPAIIALKQGGLSEVVIGAMVRRCATLSEKRGIAGDDTSADPKVKHSPGIYAFETWLDAKKLQVIRPSKASGIKSTGNGSLVFPYMTKLVMANPKSHLDIPENNPEFYFYFNVSDGKVSDFGMENSVAAQSPDEFSLIKFKDKGDSREVNIGKVSFYGGITLTNRRGIDPKYTIHFEIEQVADGIFKVSPHDPLDAGEYAFIFTGANGNSRIYDFSVTKALTKAK